jgi:MoxR-like ATPase
VATKSQRLKRGDVAAVKELASSYKSLKTQIGNVIVGQDAIIEQLFISLLSRGHCLLVGVPGLAKTLLIKTVSRALDLSFSRIQFTPDLMPSDITGTEVIEEMKTKGSKSFRFIRGPVFANIILADEINRTPPKTQAALLEAMQEHHVTSGGKTHTLDEPFFVLATQNPIEQEGTYPLPEAQLDRFMFNLWLDYPSSEEEVKIVQTTTSQYAGKVKSILSADDIVSYQELVRRVPVADAVVEFAVTLAQQSRPASPTAPDFIKKWVRWGAGPRASQFMILGAKTRAILSGRSTPDIDDVRAIAAPVFRHRLITSFTAEAEGISADNIVERLLQHSSSG